MNETNLWECAVSYDREEYIKNTKIHADSENTSRLPQVEDVANGGTKQKVDLLLS
jgi:hypothetical protein